MISCLYHSSVYSHVIQRNLKGSKVNPKCNSIVLVLRTDKRVKLDKNQWQKAPKEEVIIELFRDIQ